MFVRRDGGVSNRPGFRLWSVSDYQYDVTSLYNVRRIRTFVFGGDEYTVVAQADRNYLYVNGVEISNFYYEGSNRTGGVLIPPDPASVKFVPTKDGVLILPSCSFSGCTIVSGFDINTMTANVFIQNNRAHVVQRHENLLAPYTGTKGFTGNSPFLPVSYMVTATMDDGREVQIHAEQSTGFETFTGAASSTNPAGNSLCYPHAQLTSNLKLVFTNLADIANVKFFNLYRASGQSGIGQSFFKLAARVHNGGGTTFSFTDYGVDDPSVTPPLDTTYFHSGASYHSRVPFTGAELGCFYQQRLLVSGASIPNLKTGEAITSALGAPRQIAGPIISSDTRAFSFSVPITDGSPIAGMLSMERALLGTGKGVYIARGGEQGLLTPATVNPLKISDEGWTSSVEATMNGSRGFWINAASTKLMGAEFGADGNITVVEASLLSNHFLKQGIVQMESIGGEDDSVYLVTREGKLVRATVGDEGAFGFALYETEGFIESVYRSTASLTAPDGSGAIKPEVLYAYVIRKGIRIKERIEIREDRYKDQELFADCALWFGTKLVLDNMAGGAPGYIKEPTWVPWSEWYAYDPFGLHINIETPVPTNAYSDDSSNQLRFTKKPAGPLGNGKTVTITANPVGDLYPQAADIVMDANGNLAIEVRTTTKPFHLITAFDSNASAAIKAAWGVALRSGVSADPALQVAIPGQVMTTAEGADPVPWEANRLIKIRSNADLLNAFQDQDFVIHFYYDETDATGEYVLDENGRRKQKALRYVLDRSVPAVATGESVAAPWGYTALGFEFQGYFTTDIPEVLQDVRATYTTADLEFFTLQTRWAPAFKFFRAPMADPVKSSALRMLYTVGDAGKVVLVGEGQILSSPLNPNKNTMSIVIDGTDYLLDFGEYYSWGYVGIPYTSEMETLDIETGDNRTLTDSMKLINSAGLGMMETRGGFFGMPGKKLEEMEELVHRTDGDMFQQTQNINGHHVVSLPAEWTEGGRVNIKNVDPVPMTILSVYPKGIAGD